MRLLTFTLALALIRPETVPVPKVIPREKGSIVVSGQGRPERWTAEWSMEPSTERGLPAVHFTEAGRGLYSGYSEPISWTIDAVWSSDSAFRPLRFEKTIKNA